MNYVLNVCRNAKNSHLNLFRCIRNIAKRGSGPKFVEGKVKTLTQYDDTPQLENYQDLVRHIKESKLGDELDVVKSFSQDDTFGHPLERAPQYYDMHLREEKQMKSRIKKQIIKRKYFDLDRETNLLTYAAKEQIRFLHKSNPQEWNPAALAQCFPISEAGVKKLLRSSFSPTYPPKIKAHDEEVAERWKILKSGKYTDTIAPLTQKLYREGKLRDDYFSGNPNLPSVKPKEKVVQIKEKKNLGEFAKIVKTYVDYQEKKLLASGSEDCSENQVTVIEKSNVKSRKKENMDIKMFKIDTGELDDETTEMDIKCQKKRFQGEDLPLAQFKELLKEEKNSKSLNQSEMDPVLLETNMPKPNTDLSKKLPDNSDCFVKISKYDQRENISAMYDKDKNVNRIYKYDEKLGYQHPVGKIVKGNIKLSSENSRKGKFFRKKDCVYDENGEFLYRVPS